ncbi:hypothetical protein [Gilliamella apicola]|uniref:hypothetical protein n=1 Tax=Gilliamella apicola TaxID=1196095 RepID=UPI002FEE371C
MSESYANLFTDILEILLTLSIFFKKIYQPVSSLVKLRIPNKAKNTIQVILQNKNSDENLVKESEVELTILNKMSLVKSIDRKIGLYIYELINSSKHIVPYNYFNKLYNYMEFNGKEISINIKSINRMNLVYYFMTFVSGILMVFFAYLYIRPSLSQNAISFEFSNLLYLIFMGFFEIVGLIIWSLRIKSKEINEFNHFKNLYHDKVMSKLIWQFGDNYINDY